MEDAESIKDPATEEVDGPVEGESDKVNKDVVDHQEISGETAHVIEGNLDGEHGQSGVPEKENPLGEGEEIVDEHVEGDQSEIDKVEGEEVQDDQVEEQTEKVLDESQEDKPTEVENPIEKPPEDEKLEEEEQLVEEPPPDPTAPLNLTDSKEWLKEPFELRPDQIVEVEQLWEYFQDYTPAYSNIDNYITEKELVYMLKSLLLMTYTPEQLVELVGYVCRPPHPEGHITYDQFLKIVTMRQRELMVEDELRSALQVYDPTKSGMVGREYLKEVLGTLGHKLPQKQIDALIKEVDIANDGTLGIEDIVGTMCIDLNREDMQLLRDQANPKPLVVVEPEDNF